MQTKHPLGPQLPGERREVNVCPVLKDVFFLFLPISDDLDQMVGVRRVEHQILVAWIARDQLVPMLLRIFTKQVFVSLEYHNFVHFWVPIQCNEVLPEQLNDTVHGSAIRKSRVSDRRVPPVHDLWVENGRCLMYGQGVIVNGFLEFPPPLCHPSLARRGSVWQSEMMEFDMDPHLKVCGSPLDHDQHQLRGELLSFPEEHLRYCGDNE